MARSNKVVKGNFPPNEKEVRYGGNPDTVYKQYPSWTFVQCDRNGRWAFNKENVGENFWDTVLPFFQSIGTQTWNDILLRAKKQHHIIPVEELNKCARDRLKELQIECDEVISLRVGSTIRIYGKWQMATCSVLWYDRNHGDNDTCVCRSSLKHT